MAELKTSRQSGADPSDDGWHVLLVDDEEDVHQVTALALKHKRWKDKPFKLTSVYTGREARELLESPTCPEFDVALVDVVMEEADAGLRLCNYIRETQPRTLRIVIRTGQPGRAPAEEVLHEYDIDYYLAKPEVTPERLFVVLHSMLRGSQELATMIAMSQQLQGFTRRFQEGLTLESLLELMLPSTAFLERKYSASMVFFADLDLEADSNCIGPAFQELYGSSDLAPLRATLSQLYDQTAYDFELHEHSERAWMIPITMMEIPPRRERTTIWKKLSGLFRQAGQSGSAEVVRGGLFVEFAAPVGELIRANFLHDARLFVENWRIAYKLLQLQAALLEGRGLPAFSSDLSEPVPDVTTSKMNAKILLQEVPPRMRPGEYAVAKVLVKNTGSSRWTGDTGFALGFVGPEDENMWGTSRVPLDLEEVVPPNQPKTFEFKIKAPEEAGKHAFCCQMIQIEGAQWFGERSPKVEIEVSPFVPSAAGSARS